MGCWEGIIELDSLYISSSKVWGAFQPKCVNILPNENNSKGMSAVSTTSLKPTSQKSSIMFFGKSVVQDTVTHLRYGLQDMSNDLSTLSRMNELFGC